MANDIQCFLLQFAILHGRDRRRLRKGSAMTSTKLLALSLMLLCETVWSQGVGSVCNAALGQGLRDNYYVLTEREQFETYQKRLCDAKFSTYESFKEGSTSVGLSVPMAEAFLDLSGDTSSRSQQFSAQYAKFCSASFFDSSYRSKFAQYASQVSSVLAANWARCHELHLDAFVKTTHLGTFIDVTPQESFASFTVHVDVKKISTGSVQILHISPEDVTCSRATQPVLPGKTSIKTTKFQLTCSKNSAKEVQFSIETNGGPSNTVKVPANNSKFLELAEKNNELLSHVIHLRQALGLTTAAHAQLVEKLKTWGTGGHNASAIYSGGWKGEAGATCPEGMYVAGVSVVDEDGGQYCTSCISGVRITCKPINN